MDEALQTLFFPWMSAGLPWPEDGALFLRARAGPVLKARAWPGLVCEQSFKPDAQALQRMGLPLVEEGGKRKFSLVLLLPPRQRDEARALMARAVALTQPGGRVVAAIANTEGARSGEGDLERLVGPVQTLSKNKCRVFWSLPLPDEIADAASAAAGGARVDTALLAQWRGLDEPRAIVEGRFVSRPGLFAWDRIDPASALLAAQLPPALAGRAADLGAGFGFLSEQLLRRCPGIVALDVYEAEARALQLARRNLASFEGRVALDYLWHDVTTGLPRSYDTIVCNPPFHTGGRGVDRPDIGRAFIEAAARALNPGGRLWLVANRHLPYEAALSGNFGSVRTVTQQEGFKIIEAVRAGAARTPSSAASSKPKRRRAFSGDPPSGR